MQEHHSELIEEFINLLQGGNAHVGLKDALKGLSASMRGVQTNHLPYSIWQIVEHIRIAQWDMLEFSKDGRHKSPKWPDDYWPEEAAPANDAAWRKSIKQIDSDQEEFINLLKKADIYKAIPHGSGQTILREALQIADHNAYHIAEIVVIRRLVGAWNS
jgi:DinB superfamily